MSPSNQAGRRWTAWAPAILAAAAVALYAGSLRNGFTLDDPFVCSANGFVRQPGNWPHLFTSRYFQYSNEASYRPVCTLSYFLDGALWPGSAAGSHAFNVALYAGVAAAVFLLFGRVLGDPLAAFLGATVFVFHPIHSEVVNSIAFREDLLMALFLCGACLMLARARAGASWRPLPGAWALYGLALFSKEQAVVFPVLAWLLDRLWQPAERGGVEASRRSAGLAFGGLLAVTVFFLAVRFLWLRAPSEAAVPRLGGSLAATLLADVKIQATYLGLFVWPFRLRSFYASWIYSPALDVPLAMSAAALLVVAAAAVRHRRQAVWMVGLAWWFASLAPVANLYPIFNPMAERYLFLPSIGLCLATGATLAAAMRSRWQPLAAAGACAMLGAWTAVILLRNPAWRDDRALWEAAARESGHDPVVLANLASACYAAGDSERAGRIAGAVLSRMDGDASFSLRVPLRLVSGSAAFRRGDLDRALREFRLAEAGLPWRPDVDAAVYRNIGLVRDERGDVAAALGWYEKAASIDPFQSDLWRKIAFCHLRLSDPARARESWNRARRDDSKLPSYEEIEALFLSRFTRAR